MTPWDISGLTFPLHPTSKGLINRLVSLVTWGLEVEMLALAEAMNGERQERMLKYSTGADRQWVIEDSTHG